MSLTQRSTPTRDVAKWVKVGGTRYRAVSFESEVDADIETVWKELAGNYVNVERVHESITASYGLPGEPETGPGAVRHCDIDFQGRKVSIKERIVDWVELPDHREYTYDVYETVGFPARVFNTWRLRVGDDGRTYLGNVFYFMMKPAIMTRPMTGRMSDAARNGVLGYKRFFESVATTQTPLAAQAAAA